MYDVKMQHNEKLTRFKEMTGKTIKDIRLNNYNGSINKIAFEYDIDKGNLSKIERGLIGCTLITAWKICEASGVSFSAFAKKLEKNLGEKFKLMDE